MPLSVLLQYTMRMALEAVETKKQTFAAMIHSMFPVVLSNNKAASPTPVDAPKLAMVSGADHDFPLSVLLRTTGSILAARSPEPFQRLSVTVINEPSAAVISAGIR